MWILVCGWVWWICYCSLLTPVVAEVQGVLDLVICEGTVHAAVPVLVEDDTKTATYITNQAHNNSVV